MQSIETSLATAAKVVASVCACLVLGTGVVAFIPVFRAPAGAPALSSGYVAGEMLDLPPGVLADQARTLLIFARSTCAYCERALPTLRKLVLRVESRAGARIILATTEGDIRGRYAASLGLDADRVISYDDVRPRIVRVPAIAVLDGVGRVLFTQAGAPGGLSEAEFISAIECALRMP
jgi:hypothetical protein